MDVQSAPKTLRTTEAARYIGIAPSTLAKLRMRGQGPAYSKAGKRLVVYRTTDIDDWLLKSRRISTSST
ncbi:MAG: helix-turn-helix domain-containing protein [Mesorhizobium sp.]|uniref:helix-turn-helix transcriptional regulator n=1 Tax=Mesorhizobium sp. TaxID=1871066 RepID=UPI000F7576A6|nr:DNA-binding protein [Mesorhizobium sp. M1D.F.Ca.ET.043.01.1.1]RWA94951.1 MAG: helix-turn-helix domain-containing protein [Mesorhizobium sp.]RWE17662.1 MAG: helix-turn-helix domain-containing protein [Mesorhizobium sp.]TJW89845.1 MAG: helix-turn-helix domain-containing protein [Mesorhizobium sp.]